MPEVEATREFD